MTSLTLTQISEESKLKTKQNNLGSETFKNIVNVQPKEKGVHFDVSRNVDANNAGRLRANAR